MLTPIVKVKHGGAVTSFYNLADFERWQRERRDGGDKGQWTAK
jgi:hypothetical protein